jgi:hypothetical protein
MRRPFSSPRSCCTNSIAPTRRRFMSSLAQCPSPCRGAVLGPLRPPSSDRHGLASAGLVLQILRRWSTPHSTSLVIRPRAVGTDHSLGNPFSEPVSRTVLSSSETGESRPARRTARREGHLQAGNLADLACKI